MANISTAYPQVDNQSIRTRLATEALEDVFRQVAIKQSQLGTELNINQVTIRLYNNRNKPGGQHAHASCKASMRFDGTSKPRIETC